MQARDLAFYVDPNDPQLAERLAFLRDRGVSLIGTDGLGRGDLEQFRRIAATIERAGIRVAASHGVPGLAVPDGDSNSLRAAHLAELERAAAWGAPCVVLHFRSLSLPWHEGVCWEEAAYITRTGLEAYDARVADLLSWLCEEAARRNIAIALENLPLHHQFAYRVEEIVGLIERVGAPNLGICLDSGHAHGSGINVAAAIRTAGRHLITLHLHDNFGDADPRAPRQLDRHLAPGLGTIHWPAAIHALDAVGYQGPAIFEGVNCGKGPGVDAHDWEAAVDITLANWRAFERL